MNCSDLKYLLPTCAHLTADLWLPLVLALRKRCSLQTRVKPLFWLVLPFWPCYPMVRVTVGWTASSHCHLHSRALHSPRKSEMQSLQLQMRQEGNVWSPISWANVQNNRLLHKNSLCLCSRRKTQLAELGIKLSAATVHLARVGTWPEYGPAANLLTFLPYLWIARLQLVAEYPVLWTVAFWTSTPHLRTPGCQASWHGLREGTNSIVTYAQAAQGALQLKYTFCD